MKYAMHVRLRLLSAYLAECRDVPKPESHRVPLGFFSHYRPSTYHRDGIEITK
jgi:hypothetical protein